MVKKWPILWNLGILEIWDVKISWFWHVFWCLQTTKYQVFDRFLTPFLRVLMVLKVNSIYVVPVYIRCGRILHNWAELSRGAQKWVKNGSFFGKSGVSFLCQKIAIFWSFSGTRFLSPFLRFLMVVKFVSGFGTIFVHFGRSCQKVVQKWPKMGHFWAKRGGNPLGGTHVLFHGNPVFDPLFWHFWKTHLTVFSSDFKTCSEIDQKMGHFLGSCFLTHFLTTFLALLKNSSDSVL